MQLGEEEISIRVRIMIGLYRGLEIGYWVMGMWVLDMDLDNGFGLMGNGDGLGSQ